MLVNASSVREISMSSTEPTTCILTRLNERESTRGEE